LYFFLLYGKKAVSGIIIYGLSAFAIMVFFWPYLWNGPISLLVETLNYMSDYPLIKQVLFQGKILASNDLPTSYILSMLALTFTEPVWILFALGLVISTYKVVKKQLDWKGLLPIFVWFSLPFIYVLVRAPALYDGARHFLFIIPPVFLFAGITIDTLFNLNPAKYLNPILIILITLPGLVGIITLHPYEYAYYNTFSGGMSKVFRNFDTDYWLLCYKDSFDELHKLYPGEKTVVVRRAPSLAKEYANATTNIKPYEENVLKPGDFVLETTRINSDYLSDFPVLFEVSRQGAKFCVMKVVK
jgi:hypothetical protein